MKYLQVTINTSEYAIEELTGMLMSLGIDETVVDDPQTAIELLEKKNDYDWDYVSEDFVDKDAEPTITFYLEEDENTEKTMVAIEASLEKLKAEDIEDKMGTLKITKDVIDDEDWMNSYKDHFKTIDLTDHIIVKPSWEEVPEGNTKQVLELDPGMAFGTGDHETTSMCAVLMDEVSCEGKDVLDVGTGSGILAIAADLLGANEILGVDIDPIAVEVAIENGKINNCGDNVKFIEGDLTKGIDFKADIVVANLMAEMVVMLTKAVKNHMKAGSVFISSGILVEKKDMVIEALKEVGLEPFKIIDKGDWSAIAAR